jgi:hypothetical protein
MDATATGSNIYGNLSVYDIRDGNRQLSLGLVDSSGTILNNPVIHIGNEEKKPEIFLNGIHTGVTGTFAVNKNAIIGEMLQAGAGGSFIRFQNGIMYLYQGGVVKAQIKIATIAGVLSLAASGLPFSCEGMAVNIVEPVWTAVSNPGFGNSNSILFITYGGGKFVAVGQGGKASYSTDGITWTVSGDTTFSTYFIQAVAYGNGMFVLGGFSTHLAYSTDGANWTSTGDIGLYIMSLIYAEGMFVAGGVYGGASYSFDGITWTSADIKFGTNAVREIAYGGGRFVAVGDSGNVSYSADGINWTAVSNPGFGGNGLYGIAYGDGRFIIGGDNGYGFYSTDGITWISINDMKFGTNSIRAIIYMEGKFVAVGLGGKASYSTDGITWTAISNTSFGTGTDITSIAYNGNGRFVAAGGHFTTSGGGMMAYGNPTILARMVFNANGAVTWEKA